MSAHASENKHNLIFCLLLALATLALYSPAFRDPFLNVDDDVYVTENLHVRSGVSWRTVEWAFRTTEAANWHPLTWLSHALDCQWFGLNPAGPHIVNVLIHAANAVLVFLLLQWGTGRSWESWGVAGLFALHPINVESVAWIAERKSVLSMFFFLVALAAYGWYARRPGLGRYAAVTLAFGLGLMAKPQVVTFPFALLLVDYWPLRRLNWQGDGRASGERDVAVFSPASFGSLVWEKTPWFALSAASAVVTLTVQTPTARTRLRIAAHLANAAIAYVKYLGKAFWPVDLAALYPHRWDAVSVGLGVSCALLLVAVTVVVVIYRDRRPLLVGWFWFLGTMVPMVGLVQVGIQSMADRYAYIPLLGIFVIVCWGAAEAVRRWRIPTWVVAATAAVAFLALGFALHRQVGYWRGNATLWRRTLQVTQGNFAGEVNLATALLMEGKDEEAWAHLLHARELNAEDPVTTLDIANYERLHGEEGAALADFAKVPRLTNDPAMLAKARINSGIIRYSRKEYGEARADFKAAARLQPGVSVVYRALGLLAQKAGDQTEAVAEYRKSVEIEPSALGYLLLAQALDRVGQADGAAGVRALAGQMSGDLGGDEGVVRQLLAD